MMKKRKKIPLRKCVGCDERREKRDLIRVVRNPEGEVDIDTTGKKPGRGAYICPDRACLEKAFKAKRIERNLQVSLPSDIKEFLEERIRGEE